MSNTLNTINYVDNFKIAKIVECDFSQLSKHYNSSENNLTILSQNICSVYCNFDDFVTNLSSLNFECDILVLTECHINLNKPIPTLSNYCSYMTKCHINKADGVIVYIKDTLECKVVEIILSQASCLQLTVLNKTILCIYRSPSNPKADIFINSLCKHLDTLKTHSNIIITGDININIAPKLNERPQEYRNRTDYLNQLSTYGILPGHKIPTRKTSCLDHFMLRLTFKNQSAFIAVLHSTITDHLTTFLSITDMVKKHTNPKFATKLNFENALKDLQSSNLSILLFDHDPNHVTDHLLQKLTKSIADNSSTITIPKSKRAIKPWITTGILKCIQNRNKLQRQSRDDPTNLIKKPHLYDIETSAIT